jgi:hypothetical protein
MNQACVPSRVYHTVWYSVRMRKPTKNRVATSDAPERAA